MLSRILAIFGLCTLAELRRTERALSITMETMRRALKASREATKLWKANAAELAREAGIGGPINTDEDWVRRLERQAEEQGRLISSQEEDLEYWQRRALRAERFAHENNWQQGEKEYEEESKRSAGDRPARATGASAERP